jgi:hypothetical protein
MKRNPPPPTELREEPPAPPPVLDLLSEDERAAFIDEIDRWCASMHPQPSAATSDILYDDATYIDLGKRLAKEHRRAFKSRRQTKQPPRARLATVTIPDELGDAP